MRSPLLLKVTSKFQELVVKMASTTQELQCEKELMSKTNAELEATTKDLQVGGGGTVYKRQFHHERHSSQEEKTRMDAMMVRQYNLIQCFSAIKLDDGIADEDSPIGRIESMRKQLNAENVKNLAETEQIQTLEVLGEGSFGKVYKVGKSAQRRSILFPMRLDPTALRCPTRGCGGAPRSRSRPCCSLPTFRALRNARRWPSWRCVRSARISPPCATPSCGPRS